MSKQISSCDTFVVLPPASPDGTVIFGKNSDRLIGEVQEVIYVPSQDHPSGSKLECTYMEVEQAVHTNAVILSKPSWMWGAEMGANEFGVCIGNEAVWTREESELDHEEKLLGMDLVRLGLERAKTAKDAMDVIVDLLDRYGVGGPCSDVLTSFTYHNGFIIADGNEAWVLETAGKYWAAEHIKSGFRNISNHLSIGTKIDAMHQELKQHAQDSGYWTPSEGEFNFAMAYSQGLSTSARYKRGKELLSKTSAGQFTESCMMEVLRDNEISFDEATTSCHVSTLTPPGSSVPCCHWFTATPDPCQSFFKPFVFCPGTTIGDKTKSPDFGGEDPRQMKPRFQTTVDRRHPLYIAHQQMNAQTSKAKMVKCQISELEKNCLQDVSEILANYNETSSAKLATIFKHMVELEINFYKM